MVPNRTVVATVSFRCRLLLDRSLVKAKNWTSSREHQERDDIKALVHLRHVIDRKLVKLDAETTQLSGKLGLR
jgi:hypothetical protein